MALVRGAVQTIVASGLKSASGTAAFNLGSTSGGAESATFLLNVSASAGPTTLDIYLQTSPDGGTTWYDFAHFTQVGAVATAIQALQWTRRSMDATNATAVIVTGDAALAAAKVVNGPIVDANCRAKWVIAGTSYTFALLAIIDRD
jgi:hypothetical protein